MTPKQEKFCQAYVEAGNASEAYRLAYDADSMKPASVNRSAFDLLNNPKITSRVEALRQAHAARHEITIDSLLTELEAARQLGRETGQASAMVGATMAKAKLLGLDKNVTTIQGAEGKPAFPTTIRLIAPSLKSRGAD